jgi:hypothetical protein
MRPVSVTALASLAAVLSMALLVPTPGIAVEGIAKPVPATTLVTRVADKAAPKRRMAPPYRAPRYAGPWHQSGYWQERTGANRWVHFQYVNSGFPVRHYPQGIVTTWGR